MLRLCKSIYSPSQALPTCSRLHSALTMSPLFKGSAVLTRDAIGASYIAGQMAALLTKPTAYFSRGHFSMHVQGHPRLLQGWSATEPRSEMQ